MLSWDRTRGPEAFDRREGDREAGSSGATADRAARLNRVDTEQRRILSAPFRRKGDAPPPSLRTKRGKAARGGKGRTAGGVDAVAGKTHLMDVAIVMHEDDDGDRFINALAIRSDQQAKGFGKLVLGTVLDDLTERYAGDVATWLVAPANFASHAMSEAVGADVTYPPETKPNALYAIAL